MTGEQIREICLAAPFRPFDLLLSDGRRLRVEQPDLIDAVGDGRVVRLYTKPDLVELLDTHHVMSICFRNPTLFDDSILES
jgi:hypothetical protein